MTCSHCHASNSIYGYNGSSMQSATNRQDGDPTAIISGRGCLICGHWDETPVTYPERKVHSAGFSTGADNKRLGTKVVWAIYHDLVTRHIEVISKMRKQNKSWCDIIDYLQPIENRALTENSMRTHYARINDNIRTAKLKAKRGKYKVKECAA